MFRHRLAFLRRRERDAQAALKPPTATDHNSRKSALPRFLGGKKENSSTKMPRCCITYCPKNAIGFVKPWQGAWCFCGLENSDAGLSSPATLLLPSENGRVLSQQWPTSFAPPSVSPQFIFKMHSRSTFRCRVRRCQSLSPSGSHSHRRPRD